MHDRRLLPSLTFVVILLSVCLTGVQSQGLMGMGGFKGHHHRGSGAVELLLATGILAKLLNHRAKHGPSHMGRHMLHALIGGARYPARHPHARFPMELEGAHPSILQGDLLEPHASMAIPFADELMLNQESALLAAKSPFLMGMGTSALPMMTDSQLLAEAQISQQLTAARRARKMLEARKLLAAQEAKNMLGLQREAAQLLAAQEAAQTATLLAPSRQIFTAAHPPARMINQMNQMNQMNQQVNSGNQGQGGLQGHQDHQGHQGELMSGMMGSDRRMTVARSDQHTQLLTLPPGLSEEETAEILVQLQHMV